MKIPKGYALKWGFIPFKAVDGEAVKWLKLCWNAYLTSCKADFNDEGFLKKG